MFPVIAAIDTVIYFMLLMLCLSVVSYRFIGASILYHCMMKAIKFRLCIIKFKCYTFCVKTRVMTYFIIYFINVIRNQLHCIALYSKV